MKIIKHTIPLVFILLGFLLYANVLHGPFLFDDEMYIADNYRIRDMANFLKDFSGTRYIGFLSFALNYYFGGLNTFGYHIVNIFIHIINAMLVYYLAVLTFKAIRASRFHLSLRGEAEAASLWDCFGAKAPRNDIVPNLLAFSVSLVFLIHPIQTQAVSYITQRFTSLATFFYLLSLVLYIKYRLWAIGDRQWGKPTAYRPLPIAYYVLSILSAILAMKTKEISFTLPFVIMLYEITFFRNDDLRIRMRLLYLLPFLLTLLIIPLTFLWTQDITPAQDIGERIRQLQLLDMKLPRYSYLLIQFMVIVTYMRLLVLPVNQMFEYDYPFSQSLFEPATFISFIFLLSIFSSAVYFYFRSRITHHVHGLLISFGILWFFITLSVESSIIPIKDVIFEHRLYLPSIGFILSITASLFYGFGYLEKRINRPLWNHLLVVVVITAVILFFSAYKRNILWGDSYLMYLDNIKKAPNRAVPHNNLGNVYFNQGRIDDAIEEYQKAIKLYPDYADAYIHLGNSYRELGRLQSAIEEYQKAIKLEPDGVRAHNNLGIAYARYGRLDEAIKEFRIALKVKPDYSEAHNSLGIVYVEQERLDEAIKEFRIAFGLEPYNAQAHNNLGLVYMKKGLTAEAIKEFKEALKIKPDFTKARQVLDWLQSKP